MVNYEQRERTAVITLNRPEARNAIDPATALELEEILDRLEEDAGVWVAVLAAEGPAFCAGADLKVAAAGRIGDLFTERGGFAGFVRYPRSKPVIAAVEGPALAGGCEIALACDLIVASTAAKFGLPEVKRSLVAAAGGMFRLPRALPAKVAMEAVLTGNPIGAERAHHFGLVNRLVAPGETLTAALELAGQICENAPLAVRESRRVVSAALSASPGAPGAPGAGGRDGDDPDATLWRMSAEALDRVSATEDFAEGPRAFVEKRAPAWKAR